MIMISSPAGQRLAQAKVELDKEKRKPTELYRIACDQFREAAYALADELIADKHHTGEGD